MLSLSPAKILVVLVIALIVLGPEKLPGMARQLGAAWGDLRRLRARLESEVRGVFPDLPPSHEVAQAVRSPLSFLDRLADEHERSSGGTANGTANGSPAATDGAATAVGSGGNGSGWRAPPTEGPPPARSGAGEGKLPAVPDDPSMN